MTAALALALSLAGAPDTIGPAPPASRQVAGVAVPEAVLLQGQPLTLNGAGLRRKVVFEVYVGALYLPARSSDPAAIVASDGPWEVTLVFRRDVDHHKIQEAFLAAFEQNSPGELEQLRGDLERFHAVLVDVKEGQALVLHYLPDSGTTLTGPGGATATVPGHAFGAAMLRTWLGDHPADERLKAALLGR